MILFFIATSAANNANNAKALPLLTGFSLLTGFTLSGIVALAIGSIGIGSVGTAALATGITFVIASYTGQRMSCLLYTSPSPRDLARSRMPSSA